VINKFHDSKVQPDTSDINEFPVNLRIWMVKFSLQVLKWRVYPFPVLYHREEARRSGLSFPL